MREIDIRKSLNHKVHSLFLEEQDTIVINEFGICQGEARIDLAVINGFIHGFEIKSENDTLDRLPSQQAAYNKVFDTITIVTGDKYLDKVTNNIPSWWGIMRARQKGNHVALETIRGCKDNPQIDPYSLVQLLWQSEAIAILEKHKLAKGLKNKPRRYVWAALADNFSVQELSKLVRETLKKRDSLKKRDNWKVALLQM
jgi:hypothetical protein